MKWEIVKETKRVEALAAFTTYAEALTMLRLAGKYLRGRGMRVHWISESEIGVNDFRLTVWAAWA